MVRTDGQAGGRSGGRLVGRLLHFLTHGAPLARFARESSAIKVLSLNNGKSVTPKSGRGLL